MGKLLNTSSKLSCHITRKSSQMYCGVESPFNIHEVDLARFVSFISQFAFLLRCIVPKCRAFRPFCICFLSPSHFLQMKVCSYSIRLFLGSWFVPFKNLDGRNLCVSIYLHLVEYGDLHIHLPFFCVSTVQRCHEYLKHYVLQVRSLFTQI